MYKQDHRSALPFDCGADGILAPSVNTADDVRAAVAVAKYPGKGGKEGTRSLYVNIRAQYPGGMENLMEKALTDNKRTIVAVRNTSFDAQPAGNATAGLAVDAGEAWVIAVPPINCSNAQYWELKCPCAPYRPQGHRP